MVINFQSHYQTYIDPLMTFWYECEIAINCKTIVCEKNCQEVHFRRPGTAYRPHEFNSLWGSAPHTPRETSTTPCVNLPGKKSIQLQVPHSQPAAIRRRKNPLTRFYTTYEALKKQVAHNLKQGYWFLFVNLGQIVRNLLGRQTNEKKYQAVDHCPLANRQLTEHPAVKW